jgi:hypothetical protein
MKSHHFIAAIMGLLFAATSSGWAQATVETTTTTNSAGTISEFGPELLVVRTETAPEPIRYSYTTKTVYVDETGAPVTMTTVKSGLPVTVYYTKVGDKMVASKVVVKRTVVAPAAPVIEEKRTTTTTTTEKK